MQKSRDELQQNSTTHKRGRPLCAAEISFVLVVLLCVCDFLPVTSVLQRSVHSHFFAWAVGLLLKVSSYSRFLSTFSSDEMQVSILKTLVLPKSS